MDEIMERRLKSFSSTVMNDALKQRAKIEEQTEKEHKDRVGAREDEFLQDAYVAIRKIVTETQKADNERVLRAETEARRSLLKRREEIIDTVFEDVEKKLLDYTKTEQYKAALADKITEVLSQLGEGEKVIILTEADAQLFDAACGAKLETVAVEGFIGGVKGHNCHRGIAVDYSYYELLTLQRENFLQKSGLSLS